MCTRHTRRGNGSVSSGRHSIAQRQVGTSDFPLPYTIHCPPPTYTRPSHHSNHRLAPDVIQKNISFPPSNPKHKVLQSIDKLGILAIRQIQPFLIGQLAVMRLGAEGGLLLVLAPAVPPDEEHVDQAGAPAADDGDFGRLVTGGVFGAEGLRAYWTAVLLVHGLYFLLVRGLGLYVPIMLPVQYAMR